MSLRLSNEEYAALCLSVLKRDFYKCRNCGFRQNLHVHHIIWRSDNGPDEAWNLLTLCMSCHDGIHTDVRDGIPGLSIMHPADANYPVTFERRADWVPR